MLFFFFHRDKFNKSSLAVMRLGQGYIVAWYLWRSPVTQLLPQYLANNCQQGARGGSQGQTHCQEGDSVTTAMALRMLWSVSSLWIQIRCFFPTYIGQYKKITLPFAPFIINPHKLLVPAFRPGLLCMGTQVQFKTPLLGKILVCLLVSEAPVKCPLVCSLILGWPRLGGAVCQPPRKSENKKASFTPPVFTLSLYLTWHFSPLL